MWGLHPWSIPRLSDDGTVQADPNPTVWEGRWHLLQQAGKGTLLFVVNRHLVRPRLPSEELVRQVLEPRRFARRLTDDQSTGVGRGGRWPELAIYKHPGVAKALQSLPMEVFLRERHLGLSQPGHWQVIEPACSELGVCLYIKGVELVLEEGPGCPCRGAAPAGCGIKQKVEEVVGGPEEIWLGPHERERCGRCQLRR